MKLEELFARELSVPLSSIRDDSSPKTLQNWDSLRHVQLITSIEGTYEIRFTATEIVSLNSLANIRKILYQKGINC